MIDREVYRKWSNKRVNARKEGIEFDLTLEEYIELLYEANITHEDVGNVGYHLARYNDSGPYRKGNCRFIYYLENVGEKCISPAMRRASSENLTEFNKNRTKEEQTRISMLGGLKGGGHNKLPEDEINRRVNLIEESNINLNRCGWVTKVGELLGISHAHVKRFMDKHYEGKFYRRNG